MVYAFNLKSSFIAEGKLQTTNLRQKMIAKNNDADHAMELSGNKVAKQQT